MEKFFAFRDACLTSDIHPILTACRLLIALLHIHPFCDGNGRVSRVAMVSYLIRQGYPPMLFFNPDRIEFSLCLARCQSTQDRGPLYDYVVANIKEILISRTGLMA